jgi:hypothetical protein
MSKRKKIESLDWQDRLQSLTSGNRGRTAAIAAEGMTLVESKPFENVFYDPVDKGNDLTIALDGYMHTVLAPVELYMEENDQGVVITLEVIDQNGKSAYLRFY